jgi:transcriptional regulator of heat shock response
MDDRKMRLLTKIIDEYIASGQPVSSLFLVEKYQLGCSSATVRNDMALLEEEGYMYQPHLSAGRVPTVRGYRAYIEYLKPTRVSQKNQKKLLQIWGEAQCALELKLKQISKALSDMSGEVAFATLGEYFSHTAGFGTMCQKPEFSDEDFFQEFSETLEHIDDICKSVLKKSSQEPHILFGKGHVFSQKCSTIALGYVYRNHQGVLGIIGPLRMHYQKNISILQAVKNIIEKTSNL